MPQSYPVMTHSCTPLPWLKFLVVMVFIIKSLLDVEGFILDCNPWSNVVNLTEMS